MLHSEINPTPTGGWPSPQTAQQESFRFCKGGSHRFHEQGLNDSPGGTEQCQPSWKSQVIPPWLCHDLNHPDSVLASHYQTQETSSANPVVQFASENVPPSFVLNTPFLQHQSRMLLTMKIGNECKLLVLQWPPRHDMPWIMISFLQCGLLLPKFIHHILKSGEPTFFPPSREGKRMFVCGQGREVKEGCVPFPEKRKFTTLTRTFS